MPTGWACSLNSSFKEVERLIQNTQWISDILFVLLHQDFNLLGFPEVEVDLKIDMTKAQGTVCQNITIAEVWIFRMEWILVISVQCAYMYMYMDAIVYQSIIA